MAQVAAQAGVSAMTVSRLMRDEGLVAEPTRARIRAAIEALAYVPDQSASALSSRRTGFVAALVPSLNSTHFLNMARGMTEMFEGAGLQLLLGHTDYSFDREADLIETMLRRRPEAIVMTGGFRAPRGRRLLERAGIPVIETWDLPAKPIGHVVGFSNAAAAALVAGHFHARGYREVAFLAGPKALDPRGADRQTGFEEEARRLGLVCHALNFGDVPISYDGGGDALVEILRRWPGVRAVMCVFDIAAFGALNRVMRLGVKVPGDLALSGFGDFDIARHATPSLTTVTIDAENLGREVGRMIVDLTRGGSAAPRVVRVPVRLTVRESS